MDDRAAKARPTAGRKRAPPEQIDRERQRIRADLFGCINSDGRCLLDSKRTE